MESALRHRNSRTAAAKLDDRVKEIQRLAVCGLCGEKVLRIPHVHGRERWNCPACKGISRAVTDDLLTENTQSALNRLTASPSAVRVPPSEPVADHAADCMEQELCRQMTLSDSEESSFVQMAFDLAAVRYSGLSGEGYETERIRRCLKKAASREVPDTSLLRSITSAVLIHPNGNIQLKLKNNQII